MKKHRLTAVDLKEFRPARRVSGAFFTLSVAPLPSGRKWTCVVSKKVAQRATARNLAKRRCRAIVRAVLGEGGDGAAFVLSAKKAAAGARFADLKSDIESLLGRAGLRGTTPL